MNSIDRQEQQSTEYYPLKLSLARSGDPKKYAFLISGKDDKRVSAQGQVLNIFLRHGVKILGQWGYLDEQNNDFVLYLSCDMKNSDVTPDQLILDLRLLKSIRNVRSVGMKNRLFHGCFFPLTLLDNRVMVLDSEFTFLIEHDLSKTPESKAALVEVGRIYAFDIVRQVRAKLPREVSEEMFRDNVLEYFKAAGIGRFSLLDTEEKSVQAIVRDPPLSQRGEATGNHFLHGIVIGLIECFQQRDTMVVEDLYDPGANRLFISLLDKKNTPSQPPQTDETKIKALEEVERVISAIEGTESKQDVPIIVANSSPSLNQILKTYENEGWVGGKIGYVPESSSSTIVVRYKDGIMVEEKKKLDGAEIQSPSIEILPNQPPKNPPETAVAKPRKKTIPTEEDEEKLANAVRSAISEDSMYFEDSYFL